MPKPIMVIGEAWGKDEAEKHEPFVGPSGRLLRGCLWRAGIDPAQCHFTNVFNLQPRPTNDVTNLCGKRPEGIAGMAPLQRGKYVRAEYAGELTRLTDEIRRARPNLIIAVGNTPSWFLQNRPTKITQERGTLFESRHIESRRYKSISTLHPAAVIREWKLYPLLMADLKKAARHADSPTFTRPAREIWIEPTIADLHEFARLYMTDLSRPCGVDIETAFHSITEIGFSPDPYHAIVIPFYSRTGGNYWSDYRDEAKAWVWVREQLQRLRRPVFQNGLYDLNYLWRTMGIAVPRAGEDTMLLHHALQPEMKKSLGFLGSVYTDEPTWKTMRADQGTLKREDE